MNNYYLKKNDLIDLNELVFLQALENYTLFHLKDGSKVISSLTLKRHQEKLSDRDFLRVNRSMIINVLFINSIVFKKDTHFVCLQNGNEIKVSRRRASALAHLAS